MRRTPQQWITGRTLVGMDLRFGLEYVQCSNRLNRSRTTILTSEFRVQPSWFSTKKSGDKSNSVTATTITAQEEDRNSLQQALSSDAASVPSQYDLHRKPSTPSSTTKVVSLIESDSTNPRIEVETKKIVNLKQSNEARRLIVKRPVIDTADVSSVSKRSHQLRSRVGTIQRRFQLDNEITDSGGKTIWIPARSIIDKDLVTATKLPQINASAWLDPSTYCRGGGKSIAGTVAARQLLHGKKDLMEVLGHAVYSSTSKIAQRLQSVAINGHGVPPQLLQHHIDSADILLCDANASEIFLKDFTKPNSHDSASTTDVLRDVCYSHIRDVATGENRVIPWPMDNGTDSASDMQLYFTVMNRIATQMGLPVLLKNPRATQPLSQVHTLRSRLGDNLLPHYWRIQFSQEKHFLTDNLPKTRSQPIIPVIMWTPLDGIAWPGHVCIRLQGESSTSGRPISLCFDAYFRSNDFR
jgi:hypothetical protein